MISAERFLDTHRPVAAQHDDAHDTGDDGDDGDDVSEAGAQEDDRKEPRGARVAGGDDPYDDHALSEHAVSSSLAKGVVRASARYRSPWATRRGSRNGSMTEEQSHDVEACREAALTLLDAAPRSSGALLGRLIDKGYDPVTVDEVLLRLAAVNLIDDEAYAWMALRHCVSRMFGLRATRVELDRKGVPQDIATHVTQQAESQGMFEEAAWQLGRQIAGKTQGLDARLRKRRLWSAGGRKGHNPETLRAVAETLFD